MRKVCFWFGLALMGAAHMSVAQVAPVAFINEIHNETAQADEWTEIIVAQDNLDMRGYYLGDNNGSTDSWQPKYQFSNDAVWSHLRAGTYILIWHGQGTDCNGVNEDTDGADGLIRVCAGNSRYFDGGGSTSLSLNSSGDFLQIVTPNGTMVQAFGYDQSPGGSVTGGNCVNQSNNWTSTNSAKANTRPCGKFNFVRSDLANGSSLIQQDSSLAGIIPTPGIFFNSPGSSTDAAGMGPSSEGHGNTPKNVLLMRRLRQPPWTLQEVCYQRSQGINRITFAPASDPYLTDGTLRYVVVRYATAPASNEPAPFDGVTYAVGNPLGSGVVAGLLAGQAGQSGVFTDAPTAPDGSYYRIYAQRYTAPSQQSLAPDQGPAYNEDQYVTASPGQPMTIAGPASLCPGDTAVFTASSTTQGDVIVSADKPGLGFIVDGAVVKVYLTGSLANGTPVHLTIAPPDITPCNASGTATFTISVPSISVTGDSVIAFGDTAQIRVSGGPTIAYTPEGTLTRLDGNTFTNFLYSDTVTRAFRFTTSDNGTCATSANWTVRVQPKPVPVVPLFIPNLVIKSGLTKNKTFQVQGATVEHLQLFNRWGSVVVDDIPYGNNWAGLSGTYFYVMDLTLASGEKKTEKGWVEVID